MNDGWINWDVLYLRNNLDTAMIRDIKGQTLDDSKAIWRYLDFASFYSLLLNKELFFKRLDKYSDENEGTLWEENRFDLLKYRTNTAPYSTKAEVDAWVDEYYANIETYKGGTLANSWTVSDNEVYAMWKIYLRGSTDGVAIKTTIGNLRQALEGSSLQIYLGKVGYEPPKIGQIDQFFVSTNKRTPYSYESELRAILLHQYRVETTPDGSRLKVPFYEVGTGVPLDLNKLFGEVYTSPFSSNWFDAVVKSSIQTLMPTCGGINIKSSRIKDK